MLWCKNSIYFRGYSSFALPTIFLTIGSWTAGPPSRKLGVTIFGFEDGRMINPENNLSWKFNNRFIMCLFFFFVIFLEILSKSEG